MLVECTLQCIHDASYLCRPHPGNVQEMCRKCHLRMCHRFPQNAFHMSCVQEMHLTHQISCVQEMCLKYHLSCVLIFSFMPHNLVLGNVQEMSCVLATRNIPEISCVLATGNLPEILPYTLPGNVKEISKFPGVGNFHTMNRKYELSCRFHEISWPRKFRISSSAFCFMIIKIQPMNKLTLYNGHNNLHSFLCRHLVDDFTIIKIMCN